MNARRRRHLVIFARRPQLGVGKRRLAADVGDLAALRFSRASLAGLLRAVAGDRRWTSWLATSPDRPTDWVRGAKPIAQGSGDLGRRFVRVLRALPAGDVVVLGSDTPDVTAADVARAFASLGPAGAVLGPSPDGGYWLIGLSRRQRRTPPFEAVRWSTHHARADTLANLADVKVAMLQMREDVDDGAALKRYLAARRREPRR